jgi:hypothetical protein
MKDSHKVSLKLQPSSGTVPEFLIQIENYAEKNMSSLVNLMIDRLAVAVTIDLVCYEQ